VGRGGLITTRGYRAHPLKISKKPTFKNLYKKLQDVSILSTFFFNFNQKIEFTLYQSRIQK
jgi:hypothetical protein